MKTARPEDTRRLSLEEIAALRSAVADVFAIQDATANPAPRLALRLRGQLMVASDRAHTTIAPRFRELGYTALLRREDGLDVIYALHGVTPEAKPRLWLAGSLFLLTLISVLFTGVSIRAGFLLLDGTLTEEAALQWSFSHLWAGWPFAASLLGILAAHELAHYFVARHFGTPVSLPYFIPMPLSPFGTMGAFISMKAPPPSRRALLTIGAAGPLASFALSVPILIVGLYTSPVVSMAQLGGGFMEGNSLLYAGLKILVFGHFLPGGGYDVLINQLATAGWAGLLVTGLNLIPAGQLDGGHVACALLGPRRARQLSNAIIFILAALGLVWYGWFLWAFLVFIFSRFTIMPLDDVTPLDKTRRVMALIILIIFVLTFVPTPMTIV